MQRLQRQGVSFFFGGGGGGFGGLGGLGGFGGLARFPSTQKPQQNHPKVEPRTPCVEAHFEGSMRLGFRHRLAQAASGTMSCKRIWW